MKSPVQLRNIWRSPLLMVATALAVRLVVMGFIYTDRLDPARGHFAFGYETARIARAIASGEGFSSPLLVPTGPTAWMGPVYPYLVAGVFKAFGIYTKASALAILTLQDVMSSLTCLTIFSIAQRTFGTKVATRAGWVWVFFPYAVYIPNHWIWETTFSTLLLSVLFLMALHLEHPASLRVWVCFGLLWGVAGLANATLLSVLPFFLGWLWWRQRRLGANCTQRIGAAMLVFVATVAPWFVRNYLVFGRFIFFRSTFGAVLRMGNSEDTAKPRTDHLLPSENDEEMAKFLRMGEPAYMAEKKHDAVQFIRSHPGRFAWLTLRRFSYVWTGIWDLRPAYLRSEKLATLNIVFCTPVSFLAFLGLRQAYRNHRQMVTPYLILLGCFPLVYYVTSPHIRFRHPMDPFLVILAVFALAEFARARRLQAENEKPLKP